MKLRPAVHLAREAKRLAREESGVALMLTLAVFLLLFILCCGVYATGEIIRQRIELQNACDAAAYSASVVQAEALSRMAVVNRAMSWTYIQMSREQMDYIAFSWLDLTSVRFWCDYTNKVEEGSVTDFRHFHFEGWGWDSGAVGCGLYDYFHRHDNAFYTGVGSTLAERKQQHVSLNAWNLFGDSVPMEDIDEVLDDISDGNRSQWKRDMEHEIQDLKDAIEDLNDTLWAINRALQVSIPTTVEFVLKENLPEERLGAVADKFYWMTAGGTGGAPVAYGGTNSYFDALYNTEEDEIQFLQMAEGLPSRKQGAPYWMKNRPVVLSDYFGSPGNPIQFGSKGLRYVAGGLDQWYVRGTEEESASPEDLVEKTFFQMPGPGATNGPFPGIQRVYKHTNRKEGEVLNHFLRPNHIFQFGLNSIPSGLSMNMNQFDDFTNPANLVRKIFRDGKSPVAKKVYKKLKQLFPGVRRRRLKRIANSIGDVVAGLGNLIPGDLLSGLNSLGNGVSQAIQTLHSGGKTFSDLLSVIQNGDIPPSNEHALWRYPDQCHNVAESTALVAQYEWASAYWLCPWVKVPYIGLVELGHYRIPVSELLGCEYHGYGEMLAWLAKQLQILEKGHVTRDEYRSCFINFDPTTDMDKNTFLRGYARIYGDDKDIFNVTGYVGAVAKPWVLDESFFSGDGTILVGVAREQENPFVRLLARGVEGVLSSIYDPFSPQAGADRYLVALSAARAVWAPRPDHPGTGMETMNNGRAPGQYEPRFDSVTDNKFGIANNKYASMRMGCVCGKEDTQGRLLRMWNLSQTDWDGALLPLRHAFDGHSHYDSYAHLTDGSEWEFDGTDKNAVIRLVDILFSHLWHGLHAQWKWRTSAEVMVIPDATAVSPSFLDSLEVLMPTPVRVTEMFLFRRLL